MSAAGAESVMDPDRHDVRAGRRRTPRRRSTGICPDTDDAGAARAAPRRRARSSAGDVPVNRIDRGAGVDGLVGLLDASPPRPRPARRACAARARATAARKPAAGARVVRLDDDALVERPAAVDAAADAHGVLLQHAQQRQRLARVGDAERAAAGVDAASASPTPRRTGAAGSSAPSARPSASAPPAR